MNAYKNVSYVGYVLYLIAAVLIIYGSVNLSKQQDLQEKGIKTKGKVVDLLVVEPYRRAIVKFKTKKKKSITFVDKLFWAQDFKKYKKGSKVEVIYDPKSPASTAMINEFFQQNTEPYWPMIVGAIVFIVGFILRKIMLKKAKKIQA